jgi:predicted dinucleotide-binding enzyme
MNIGIIGSGHIGGTAARLFAAAGHSLVIANSRGPGSLAEFVAAAGERVQAATVDEAAVAGEAVLVAIPFGRYGTLPAAPLSGKIVVDAMNYYAQRDGAIARPASSSRSTCPAHGW